MKIYGNEKNKLVDNAWTCSCGAFNSALISSCGKCRNKNIELNDEAKTE
jgi:hypothetical protein